MQTPINNPTANSPSPQMVPPQQQPQQSPQQAAPQMPPPKKPPSPPTPFGGSVPGQSLTDTPKNAQWEHPPQYTRVNDALNFIFDSLVTPVNLKQTLMFLQKGMTVEDLARMIIFSGFHQGKWTPDLGMMMARPLVSIIAGIAHRAGVKDAKMTREDRSGFKHLLSMHRIQGLTSTTPEPVTPQREKSLGLMAPKGI